MAPWEVAPGGLGLHPVTLRSPSGREVLRPALSSRKRMQTTHIPIFKISVNVKRGETKFNSRFYLTQ